MSQPSWWSRSVELSAGPHATGSSRRQALEVILAACGVAAVAAYAPDASAQLPPLEEPVPEIRLESRTLFDMQKQYGWSFGAATENLTFDGASTQPFDPAALEHLAEDMRPSRKRHAPFYIPTLFQAPTALPWAVPPGDPAPVAPLGRVLRPIFTPAMDVAYRRGKALAALLRTVYSRAAIVVDLPGPEAVAFAAGAADVLDPIFLFDNWPHPRGVVPAHLTLAAAAYYQPLFAHHAAPPGAPPMFVLDRNRLALYIDDEAGFDNRHTARLPSAEALKGMDIGRVLYVTPTSADTLELDDLNEDFVAYGASNLDVKLVAAEAFQPELVPLPLGPATGVAKDDDRPRYYYGGHASTSMSFWLDYPWVKPPRDLRLAREPAFARPGAHYAPMPRLSPHSSGMMNPHVGRPTGMIAALRQPPVGFGQVKVVVSAFTNKVLGAAASRSGTWGRASSATGG